VLVNISNAKNADGYLVAYLSTLGYSITEVITLTITPASTSAVSTQPTSSVSTQPAIEIATIGLAVGIAVGLIAIIMSRKRKPTPNETERTED
jgi:beta-lactamase regulating signal transducer with metallopeptidase domain